MPNRIVEHSGQASVSAVNNAMSEVGEFVQQVTKSQQPYELRLSNDNDKGTTNFSCSTVDPATGKRTVASVNVLKTEQHTLYSRTAEVMDVGAAAAEFSAKHFAGVCDNVAGAFCLWKNQAYNGACVGRKRIADLVRGSVKAVCQTGLHLVGEDTEPESKRGRVQPASASAAAGEAASGQAASGQAASGQAASGQ